MKERCKGMSGDAWIDRKPGPTFDVALTSHRCVLEAGHDGEHRNNWGHAFPLSLRERVERIEARLDRIEKGDAGE